MPVTITRALALVAFLVAIVLLVPFVYELVRGDESSVPPAANSAQPAPRVANEMPASHAPAVVPAPAVPPLTSPAPPSGQVTVTPVNVAVHAPSVASADEPFDAYVHIDAPSGLHRLQFAVAFDRKTLTLTGVSEGDLAQRGGLPADFSADEPSEGNLEVTFTIRNGLALTGAGNVAVLHFEPRKPGTVTIKVSNLTAFDNTGAVRFRAQPPPVSISIQ